MALNGMQIDAICYIDYQQAKDAYTNFVAHIATPVNTILQPDTLDVSIVDAQGAYSVENPQTGNPAGDFYTQFSHCEQTTLQQPISDVIFICAVVVCAILGLIAGQQR